VWRPGARHERARLSASCVAAAARRTDSESLTDRLLTPGQSMARVAPSRRGRRGGVRPRCRTTPGPAVLTAGEARGRDDPTRSIRPPYRRAGRDTGGRGDQVTRGRAGGACRLPDVARADGVGDDVAVARSKGRSCTSPEAEPAGPWPFRRRRRRRRHQMSARARLPGPAGSPFFRATASRKKNNIALA